MKNIDSYPLGVTKDLDLLPQIFKVITGNNILKKIILLY
jgi:hypothetical protein